MTNLEYIKTMLLDEREMANLLAYGPHDGRLQWKIVEAHSRWAERFGDHKGNVVSEKGNPSIWDFEIWHYPDGHTEKKGRNHLLSMQV